MKNINKLLIINGEFRLWSRAHRLWAQHRTTVNDVIGLQKAGIADVFVPCPIITHIQVHRFITGHNSCQQFAVTICDRKIHTKTTISALCLH